MTRSFQIQPEEIPLARRSGIRILEVRTPRMNEHERVTDYIVHYEGFGTQREMAECAAQITERTVSEYCIIPPHDHKCAAFLEIPGGRLCQACGAIEIDEEVAV